MSSDNGSASLPLIVGGAILIAEIAQPGSISNLIDRISGKKTDPNPNPSPQPSPNPKPNPSPQPNPTPGPNDAKCCDGPFADLYPMRQANPNIDQQMIEWQALRAQRGEDPWTWSAFRSHVRALGAPDPGSLPFEQFCYGYHSDSGETRR